MASHYQPIVVVRRSERPGIVRKQVYGEEKRCPFGHSPQAKEEASRSEERIEPPAGAANRRASMRWNESPNDLAADPAAVIGCLGRRPARAAGNRSSPGFGRHSRGRNFVL